MSLWARRVGWPGPAKKVMAFFSEPLLGRFSEALQLLHLVSGTNNGHAMSRRVRFRQRMPSCAEDPFTSDEERRRPPASLLPNAHVRRPALAKKNQTLPTAGSRRGRSTSSLSNNHRRSSRRRSPSQPVTSIAIRPRGRAARMVRVFFIRTMRRTPRVKRPAHVR